MNVAYVKMCVYAYIPQTYTYTHWCFFIEEQAAQKGLLGIVLIVSRFHGYMNRSLLRPYYEVRERSRALRVLHTI